MLRGILIYRSAAKRHLYYSLFIIHYSRSKRNQTPKAAFCGLWGLIPSLSGENKNPGVFRGFVPRHRIELWTLQFSVVCSTN